MRRWWGRRLRLAVGVLVWIAIVLAVVVSWEDVRDGLAGLGMAAFAFAVLVIGAGIVAGARGWVVLQPKSARLNSAAVFIAAQPAKYLPLGGAAQAASQIGLSSVAGSSRVDLAWNFLIYLAVQAAGAMVISLGLLAAPETPTVIKGMIVLGAATSLLAIHRPVLSWAVTRVADLWRRVRRTGSIPESRALVTSLLWAVIPLVLSGSMFGVFLYGIEDLNSVGRAIAVFALAWVFGLVLFPFPSGIGAREAALIFLIPSLPSAQILAVSLAHRFATLLAELLLLAAVSRRVFMRGGSG